MPKRIVEKSEVPSEEEIILILSPALFFWRKKFVGKGTQKLLYRLSVDAHGSKEEGYVHIPSSFFDHPIGLSDPKSSWEKPFAQEYMWVFLSEFRKISRTKIFVPRDMIGLKKGFEIGHITWGEKKIVRWFGEWLRFLLASLFVVDHSFRSWSVRDLFFAEMYAYLAWREKYPEPSQNPFLG